jgi:ectoine hydroxylase
MFVNPPVTDEPTNARTAYEQSGWHELPHRLQKPIVDRVRDSVARISAERRPEVVYEEGTSIVRAIHGCHRFDEACAALVRLPTSLRSPRRWPMGRCTCTSSR